VDRPVARLRRVGDPLVTVAQRVAAARDLLVIDTGGGSRRD
jgi:hypothetical protein